MPTVKIPSICDLDTLWHWRERNPVLRSRQLAWRWSEQVASVFFYCSFMVIHLAFSASGLSLQQVKQSQRRTWAIGCSEAVGNCSHKLWFFLREFEPRKFFFLEIHLLKWIEDCMPPARYVQCLCRVIGLFNQTCEIVKF